jgi:type IV pilus assembly protein PilP
MRYLILASVLILSGCGQNGLDDLKAFMAQAGQGAQPALEPLPPIKQVETFSYDPDGLPDPFKPRSMKPGHSGGGKQPDMNRPKGPLENFPLDALHMVGTIEKDNTLYALVKTPDNALYRVKKGDYMGQNYGLVVNITNTNIELKESIQDGTGDWIESKAQVALQE